MALTFCSAVGYGNLILIMASHDNIPSRFPEDRSLEQDLGLWWILHSKPNREWKLAKYLLNHEISYYLPIYQRKTRIGYFRLEKIIPTRLFRGYICIALDTKNHHLLYDTHDFVRIIKVNDQNGFVREIELVAKAIETGHDLFVMPGIMKGRRVRITSGPLKGAEGVVVGRSKKGQFAITVEMFNRTVIVNVDPFTNLELA
ncbi:MAG: transcription termination/antitermination NusG family protein [Pseudomonadota bacterium]